jgi:hypothetical protein
MVPFMKGVCTCGVQTPCMLRLFSLSCVPGHVVAASYPYDIGTLTEETYCESVDQALTAAIEGSAVFPMDIFTAAQMLVGRGNKRLTLATVLTLIA